ncbi:MAG: hypothetical protein PHW10_00205 [Candidatus Peribacteraceae bacterium]|nr:hypothetical protein [Candidatus Peribacteraceae bacterium]
MHATVSPRLRRPAFLSVFSLLTLLLFASPAGAQATAPFPWQYLSIPATAEPLPPGWGVTIIVAPLPASSSVPSFVPEVAGMTDLLIGGTGTGALDLPDPADLDAPPPPADASVPATLPQGIEQDVQPPVYAEPDASVSPLRVTNIYAGEPIAQATESYAWYGNYIRYETTATTTVNAQQTINTSNVINIVQYCEGGGCTQNANASGSAVSNGGQIIDADATNSGVIIQQSNGTPSTGSGSVTSPGIEADIDATTDVQSDQNALSGNTALTQQTGADAEQDADAVATASSAVDAVINGSSGNDLTVIQ